MSPIPAVLIYLAAMALPALLLYHFHALHWSLHLLALAAAIGLGFVPIPPELQRPGFDLLFGFVFVSLLIWGAGGLVLYSTQEHHHKHA
jgi:hypothetical protein